MEKLILQKLKEGHRLVQLFNIINSDDFELLSSQTVKVKDGRYKITTLYRVGNHTIEESYTVGELLENLIDDYGWDIVC